MRLEAFDPHASLSGTWLPPDTWRGFAAQLGEGAFVAWMLTAPLLSLVHWLFLGAFLWVSFFVGRRVLRRIVPIEVRPDATSRYRPGAFFGHRNFLLNFLALLAAFGADRIGAFLLIVFGAAVDYWREWDLRRNPSLHDRIQPASGRWLSLAVIHLLSRPSWLIASLFVAQFFLWIVPTNLLLDFPGVDALTRLAGHILGSIPTYAEFLIGHNRAEEALRFRAVASFDIFALLCLLVLLQRTFARFFIPRRLSPWEITDPALASLVYALPLIAFYLALANFGPGRASILAHGDFSSFGFKEFAVLTLYFASTTVFLLCGLGIAARIRAHPEIRGR